MGKASILMTVAIHINIPVHKYHIILQKKRQKYKAGNPRISCLDFLFVKRAICTKLKYTPLHPVSAQTKPTMLRLGDAGTESKSTSF